MGRSAPNDTTKQNRTDRYQSPSGQTRDIRQDIELDTRTPNQLDTEQQPEQTNRLYAPTTTQTNSHPPTTAHPAAVRPTRPRPAWKAKKSCTLRRHPRARAPARHHTRAAPYPTRAGHPAPPLTHPPAGCAAASDAQTPARNEDTKAAPHGRNDAATHTHLRTSPPSTRRRRNQCVHIRRGLTTATLFARVLPPVPSFPYRPVHTGAPHSGRITLSMPAPHNAGLHII